MKHTTMAIALGLLVAITPMSMGAESPHTPSNLGPITALTGINNLSNPKLIRGLSIRLEGHRIPRIITLKGYTLRSGGGLLVEDKTFEISFKRLGLSTETGPKSLDFSHFLRISGRKIGGQPETEEEQPQQAKTQKTNEVKAPDPQPKPHPPKTQPEPPKQQPQKPAGPTTVTYTVKAGDQLGLVAYQYNTTVAEIMGLNNLSSPDVIFVGQVLVVYGSPRKIPDPYQNGNAIKGGSAVAAQWDFVNVNFPIGTKARVTDIATGLSYQVVRMSGFLHADVEPVTAADTAIMKKIYNGQWKWNFRPVVVTVNGHRFAASINGMPHDIQTVYNNNFPGHSCIHFLGSKNHFNQQQEPNHQLNVHRAVGH